MENTKLNTLKEELAAVELDQRFEMVNAAADSDLVDITNFICSPRESEQASQA